MRHRRHLLANQSFLICSVLPLLDGSWTEKLSCQLLATFTIMEKNPIAVEDEPTTNPIPSPEDGERKNDLLELQRTVTGSLYSIFTPRAKIFIVVAVSISSLISPFGATTFYPALDVIAKDLGVTPTLINLSLTTYMVSSFSQIPYRCSELLM